jgi:hypothetical protein
MRASRSRGGLDFAIDTTDASAVMEAALMGLKPDATLALLGAGHDPR